MTDRPARDILRSAAALGAVAVIGTTLLAAASNLTRDRIEAEERRIVREQLAEVLPAGFYDNSPQDDFMSFADESHFPRGQSVTAYRARSDGEVVAVALRFSAVNGYNGNISLLAGIDREGKLTGVRVIAHSETPGLGDAIEAEKSDWVLSFEGRSLRNPEPGAWAVRRDGGEFDQLTGATVTPRAVVLAVRDALRYFSLHRAELIETIAEENDS